MRWTPGKRPPSSRNDRVRSLRLWPRAIAAAVLSVVCLAGLAWAQTGGDAPQESAAAPTAGMPLPNDVPSLEQRGDLYMVRKYYAEAAEAYRKLTVLQPKNAVFHNKLGIAYHQLQDLETARKAYRKAIQVNPRYAQAINNLAAVEYAQKRYRSAILTYLRALKITPRDPVIYSNLGTAYFAQEKFEYATQSYKYALQLDPEVFRRSGRVGTIVQQRDEKNAAAFNFYMAKTYASTANVEETLQYLRKAWEEGFPEIRQAILKDEAFQFLALDTRFQELLVLIEASETQSAGRQQNP